MRPEREIIAIRQQLKDWVTNNRPKLSDLNEFERSTLLSRIWKINSEIDTLDWVLGLHDLQPDTNLKAART